MKTSDIRRLNRVDLEARLTEAENNMGELQYKHGMSQLENPLRVRQLRKDIARLRTLLRELDLQPVSQG